MCTYEYSGGVNTDHSSVIGLVATTVAHEMGHNFGEYYFALFVLEIKIKKSACNKISGNWSTFFGFSKRDTDEMGPFHCAENSCFS